MKKSNIDLVWTSAVTTSIYAMILTLKTKWDISIFLLNSVAIICFFIASILLVKIPFFKKLGNQAKLTLSGFLVPVLGNVLFSFHNGGISSLKSIYPMALLDSLIVATMAVGFYQVVQIIRKKGKI